MNTYISSIPDVVPGESNNRLTLEQHTSVAVEAGDVARLLALVTRQRDALEARYLELQGEGDVKPVGRVPGIPRISGFAQVTGNAASTAPRSARRPDTPGTSAYGATPRGMRVPAGVEREAALQVAMKRLERELEIETKRREAAEREVHRLRLLTDRARYTKKFNFHLTPRVVESPRLPPGGVLPTARGGGEQTNCRKPLVMRRAPVVAQSEVERLTTELRGAFGKLTRLAAFDGFNEKENALKNGPRTSDVQSATSSDQPIAIYVFCVV